jgi:hypothetical protein
MGDSAVSLNQHVLKVLADDHDKAVAHQNSGKDDPVLFVAPIPDAVPEADIEPALGEIVANVKGKVERLDSLMFISADSDNAAMLAMRVGTFNRNPQGLGPTCMHLAQGVPRSYFYFAIIGQAGGLLDFGVDDGFFFA